MTLSNPPPNTGQTYAGPHAVVDGRSGAPDEPVKQLELPHLQPDGENQWEVWTNPQSGEPIRGRQRRFQT